MAFKFDLSKSKWETSHFGGYRKILMDYPTIKKNWDVDWEIDRKKIPDDLSSYTVDVLLKLFLLKVKEFHLTSNLVIGAKLSQKTKYYGFSKKKVGILDSFQVGKVLSSVIAKEDELKNLFDNYKNTIVNTEFYCEMPEDEKPKENKSGSGSSDEKNKNEGENKKGDNDDKSSDGDSKDSGGSKEDKQEEEKKEDKPGSGSGEDNKKESKKSEEGSNPGNKPGFAERFCTASEMKHIEEMFSDIKVFKFESWGESISGDLKKDCKFTVMPKKPHKIVYTPEQELNAGRLVKLLDISFDPEIDVVKNLKTGKLDVAKLAEVMGGNTNLYYKVEENQTTRPFSVCILCDESGSMRHGSGYVNGHLMSRIGLQIELVTTLYNAFSQILPQDKISVFGHTGDDSPLVRVYHDKMNPFFEETIDYMRTNDCSNNYDGPVIEAVYDRIRNHTDDNIIFISISDGQPAGRSYGGSKAIDDMKKIIEKCKRDGFVTMGIGFSTPIVKTIYNYNTVINNYHEEMIKSVSTLINTVVRTEFQS